VVHIIAPLAEIGKVRFQICTADGRAITSASYQEAVKNDLPVAHLKSGNYFIKITDRKRFVVKPFVKE
jgi:hypothetical protein